MALLDLAHPIRPGTPANPTQPELVWHCLSHLDQGADLTTSAVTLPLHLGTHLDAPVHIDPDGAAIDEIPLDRFDRYAVVVDARRAGGDLVTVADVLAGGVLPHPGDSLLIHTGRGELFDSPDYQDFPSLSGELCRWAVDQQLGMVGTDSLSPDQPLFRRGDDFDFVAHRTLLGAGLLIGENLRNLGPLVGRRVRVRAFPLPVVGGDGAPARIVAEA